jgi:heat shock protein HslJ
MMKTVYSLILFFLCAGGSYSCKTGNTCTVDDLNGKWQIIAVKNEPVKSAAITPFLEFDVAAKTVHGNTSCNTMNAAFETDAKNKAAIRFAAPVSTMMACINMETEAKIIQVIPKIASVKKGDAPNQVKLVCEHDNTLLVLEKI